MLTAPSTTPVFWSTREGMPKPTAEMPVLGQLADDVGELVEQRDLGGRVRGALDRLVDAAVCIHDPCQDLGAAEVDADDAVRWHVPWVT